MKKSLKFAHLEGHTDLAFSEDGRYILTCGVDGDVRVWDGIEDDDPVSHRVGDEATAIAVKGKKFYVGNDMNSVQAYTFPEGSPDGLITRFTAAVTHIQVSKNGDKVCAGSCDMVIKVCKSSASKDVVLSGHEAPILSIALDPKEEFLASSCCDGKVRIYELKTGQCIHHFACVPQSNDFGNSPVLCRLAWEPTNGKFLAVPQEKEINLLARDKWNAPAWALKDERIQSAVSVVAWSPCSGYLAASTATGEFLVFDVELKQCVSYLKQGTSHPVSALSWNPVKKGEIGFCTTLGQLGYLTEVMSAYQNKPESRPASRALEMDSEPLMDEDMEENEISITQIKRQTGFIVDDEKGDVFTGLDGLINTEEEFGKDFEEKTSVSVPFVAKANICLQEPFIPGSTPQHFQHRYMLWNGVGLVRSHTGGTEEEEGYIDVEFHDTTLHHALHIQNFLGHTMAALSNQSLALACPVQSDAPSKLVCLHFGSWDGQKEWTVSLADAEEIQSVAIGAHFVAVATDKQNLRLFTLGGLQRGVLSLSGPVVCMAAHSSSLMVVYHGSNGVSGSQCLHYGLLDVPMSHMFPRWVVMSHTLPLTPKSELSWAGFSEEGSPISCDSVGLVRIMKNSTWLPLLDTKFHIKGKSDNYFLSHVSEVDQTVAAIFCKGGRYPPTLPRPPIVTLPFRLPFCEMNNEKGQQEENLFRSSLFSNIPGADALALAATERGAKEAFMKLFALACQTDREFRAVEVAQLMPTTQLVQLAVKYASRARRKHLADKLTDLAERRMYEEEELRQSEELEASSQYSHDYVQNSQSNNHLQINNSHYRDLFASQSSIDVAVMDPKDNPLIAAKRSETPDAPKSIKSVSQPRRNPFVKNASAGATPRPLSPSSRGTVVFDDVGKLNSSGPPKEQLKNVVIRNTAMKPKAKQTTLFAKKTPTSCVPDDKKENEESSISTSDSSAPVQTSGKTGVMLWLEQHKDELKKEFPEVDDTQITRTAMQRFKALPEHQKQKYTTKRKADDVAQGEPQSKSAASKLSSFSFNSEN